MYVTNRWWSALPLVCLLLLAADHLQAQISEGGEPYSFRYKVTSDIDKITMPEVDVDALLAEDKVDAKKGVPMRFGYPFEVSFGLDNAGTWEKLPDGSRLWRLEIETAGAYSINLIYDQFFMPPGGTFFVYSNETNQVLGAFTENNNKDHGKFSTAPTAGASCVLEYHEPAEAFDQGRLNITRIVHAYRSMFHPALKDFGDSGSCNNNVVCPEAEPWDAEIRSVAMILSGGGFRLCSGAMVNNVRRDGTPYFLTADHCLGGNDTWIIMFNYNSPTCTPNQDGPTNFTISGTTLRANHSDSDFALLELSSAPPAEWDVVYAGWSAIDVSSPTSVGIHHPAGDVKKISWDDHPTISDTYLGGGGVPDSHWKIEVWDDGTTEGGSSGSPIFDPDHRITGQLHGGFASCASLTADWYGKFSMSWDRHAAASANLKAWLDPDDTGTLVLDALGAADPTDPRDPDNVAAYSDFTTPTSVQLSWTDPTEYVDGSPLVNFTIEIFRDEVLTASVASGVESYNDTGLNDGQEYEYLVYAKDINDSLSTGIPVSAFSGGSPVPGAPSGLACSATTTSATLNWTDPTTQSDGTPLDDLAGINVYRNGALIASVAPGAGTYVDNPAPGFSYIYTVRAEDNEAPANLSDESNAVTCFVGDTPEYLVWVGPDVGANNATSGDSLFEALVANGESAFLSTDLFEFGSDLSIYSGVFVVLGIYPNNHLIDAGSAEANALESYIQGAGNLFVEGGDCYNYDNTVGGVNMLPWFSLGNGSDGSADLPGVDGINDLSAFSFSYNGENNWMDELNPIASTAIWQNSSNPDLSGVWYDGFGSGVTIGIVPSFGGFISSEAPLRNVTMVVKNQPQEAPVAQAVKHQARTEPVNNIQKRGAYFPELKDQRKQAAELYRHDAGGVQIMANNQNDLMAAYLGLMGDGGDPGGKETDMTLSIDSAFVPVPAAGDTFPVAMTMTNLTNGTVSTTLWIDLTLPNNQTVPALTPRTIGALPPQGVLSRSPLMRVQASGPAGTYTVKGYWVSNGDTCCITTTFEKLSAAAMSTAQLSELETVPDEMVLFQNYPNPFNPSTTIRYGLKEDGFVSVKIYNTLGQEVATLVQENQSAGYRSVVWNGRNNDGQAIASGIYIYRMMVASQTANGRVDYVKSFKMLFAK